jgi:hypothetical protein
VTWLLILHLSTMSDPIAVGMMIDNSACTIAGIGMARILEEANPDLTVQVECRDMEERA